jgi:hypothetical protein
MNGWVLVMQCPDANMAPLIQGGLESEGIPAVVMNKQDSSYVGMCFATRPVEIWVPEAKAELAQAWLNALEG